VLTNYFIGYSLYDKFHFAYIMLHTLMQSATTHLLGSFLTSSISAHLCPSILTLDLQLQSFQHYFNDK